MQHFSLCSIKNSKILLGKFTMLTSESFTSIYICFKLNQLIWLSYRIWLQFSSFQPLSLDRLFVTVWTAACQTSLSITNPQSLLKLISIESVMPSHPLSSPSPPPFNLSYNHGLFKRISSSHQVAKVLEFQLQYQSFQWIFRTDFL